MSEELRGGLRCKGAWALGTACGSCDHCIQTFPAFYRGVKAEMNAGLKTGDELERLRAENERLRAALKPFANEVSNLEPWMGADGHDGPIDDCPLWKFSRCWHGDCGPTVGDCRRAAALLAAGSPGA